MGNAGEGANRTATDWFLGITHEKKKEEFPGIMENMLPGNSFPQICVVSVNKYVGKLSISQEHGRSDA